MIFLGDTHGNWNYVFWRIKQLDIKDTIIYHVGDIGVGFTSYDHEMKQLEVYNEQFKKYGIVFYGIRGNHDNPYFFDGGVDLTNLKLLPDYTLLNLEGKGILGIGGATSIDRKPRIQENYDYIKYNKEKRVWWPGEVFVLNEEKITNLEKGSVNIVVTHTAPSFCFPRNDNGFHPVVESFAHTDNELKTDLLLERGKLTELYNLLNKDHHIDKWFYGHFHNHHVTLEGATEFILLNINETYDLKDDREYERLLNEKYGE